ncbi:MAG: hypothetical protein [Microviridae sp.]|nr:MAG: hypothetical protein [Microviridae sp.]
MQLSLATRSDMLNIATNLLKSRVNSVLTSLKLLMPGILLKNSLLFLLFLLLSSRKILLLPVLLLFLLNLNSFSILISKISLPVLCLFILCRAISTTSKTSGFGGARKCNIAL